MTKKESTKIYRINDDGKIEYVALYTLPAEKALICYRQQKEFNNNNTWNYPDHDPAIKQMKNGEYVYETGENTVVYTKGA